MKREGADWAVARATGVGRDLRASGGDRARRAGQRVAARSCARTIATGTASTSVEYHPACHELMRLSIGHGMHALPWREPRAGAHVARAAMFYLTAQVDAGHGCPISMTYSAVPALRAQAQRSRASGSRASPRTTTTRGLLPARREAGRALRHGDDREAGRLRRARQHDARDAAQRRRTGGEYEITGHKWFCSAPMCDAFLVLAQTDGGLSCFLMPRWLPGRDAQPLPHPAPEGQARQPLERLERGRVRRGAWARMVGEEGRGVPTIIEMVNHTRLDCVIGAAAGMRQAVAQATHHAAHRSAFGKRLDRAAADAERPRRPVRRVGSGDRRDDATRAPTTQRRRRARRLFARLATAVVKYWVCKRWPPHAAEALECLGGSGYVEESPLARLYRESPLQRHLGRQRATSSRLDVLRAMGEGPEVVDAFFAEVDSRPRQRSAPRRGSSMNLRDDLRESEAVEARARDLVERMALRAPGLAARCATAIHGVAEAFCASRLAGQHRLAFGTLPPRLPLHLHHRTGTTAV